MLVLVLMWQDLEVVEGLLLPDPSLVDLDCYHMVRGYCRQQYHPYPRRAWAPAGHPGMDEDEDEDGAWAITLLGPRLWLGLAGARGGHLGAGLQARKAWLKAWIFNHLFVTH